MRPSIVLLSLMLSSACAIESVHEDASGLPERGPLGKADNAGSCMDSDCDGPAEVGNCWCDEACVEYGDCCSDYQALCHECPNLSSPPPDFCPNGDIEPVLDDEGICVVSFECVESCRNLTSPPPDFCPDGHIEGVLDAEGRCVIAFECVQ